MIFKGLSMKETTQIFLEGESPTLMISFHWIFSSVMYFCFLFLETGHNKKVIQSFL